MVKFVAIILACAIAGVLAEPPSPRQYLPPGRTQPGGNPGGNRQQASNQYSAPSSQYGAPSANAGGFGGYAGGRGGSSDDDLAEPANYEFSYEVQDDESGNNFGHKESREGDEARGSYHVLLPDGRTLIVDYIANNEGYMPTIRYEEAQQGQGGQGGQGGYPSSGRGGQGGYNY